MKSICLFLLSLASLHWSIAQSNPVANKRLALVIGNSNYDNGEKLPTAVNDADDIAKALQAIGIEVILCKDANKTLMQKTVNEFTDKLKGYEAGLVYYSGAGIMLEGEQFLMPTDANPTSTTAVDPSYLSVQSMMDGMATATAKTNIIVLNTDRNNTSPRRWNRAGASLGSMDTPIGFVLAYATSPGRQIIRSTERNSLYTTAFLKAISVPNISIIQMLNQVRQDVVTQSNYKQMPWESTSLTSDFYLYRK